MRKATLSRRRAAVVGLIYRGVLRATFNEPRRCPTGIIHVIVDGVAVIDGGVHTTALPGRVLRRAATGIA